MRNLPSQFDTGIRALPNLPEKQRVVSVQISKTSYAEVVELCKQWAAERRAAPISRARYICVTSVHGIIMAYDDPKIAGILNTADIATPDGMPVVWALRSFGAPSQQRVYGPTLMLELCRSAALHGHRLFLYGGREDTLPELESRLTAQFPGLIVAGRYSPPFRALTVEEDAQVQTVIAKPTQILFLSASAPLSRNNGCTTTAAVFLELP